MVGGANAYDQYKKEGRRTLPIHIIIHSYCVVKGMATSQRPLFHNFFIVRGTQPDLSGEKMRRGSIGGRTA